MCACLIYSIAFWVGGVCELGTTKEVGFSGFTALWCGGDPFVLMDKSTSRVKLLMIFKTNITMQENILFLFFCPVFSILLFLYHDKHMDYAAWFRSCECSVLISVHVIYTSTVFFTTHKRTHPSRDCTLYVRALVTTCRVDARHFDNIITHMLGAEASVSWFVGVEVQADGLCYSCSQET